MFLKLSQTKLSSARGIMSQSNTNTTIINAEQPREGPGNGRISGSVCAFPNAEQSKEGPGSQPGRIFGSAVGGKGLLLYI